MALPAGVLASFLKKKAKKSKSAVHKPPTSANSGKFDNGSTPASKSSKIMGGLCSCGQGGCKGGCKGKGGPGAAIGQY